MSTNSLSCYRSCSNGLTVALAVGTVSATALSHGFLWSILDVEGNSIDENLLQSAFFTSLAAMVGSVAIIIIRVSEACMVTYARKAIEDTAKDISRAAIQIHETIYALPSLGSSRDSGSGTIIQQRSVDFFAPVSFQSTITVHPNPLEALRQTSAQTEIWVEASRARPAVQV